MRMRFSRDNRTNQKERGVVLIAVLVFIALILPVTLLILDSVRIESLLPVNEAYTRTAGDEADKGFQDALAAIMADQDPFIADVSQEITTDNPYDSSQDYFIYTDPDTHSGEHEFDYLAEQWARHPDNDTIFLVERSLENIDHPDNPDADPDEDLHSVPTRWQLMNVPFGMDDFGEYYLQGSNDFPRLLLPFEYIGEDNTIDAKAPAYYIDPSEMSMLNLQHGGPGASPYTGDNLLDYYWELSPADPNYYEDIDRLDPVRQFIARPSSYFRNTDGEPDVSINDAWIPANEGSIQAGFMRETSAAVDRLVYDGLYDFQDTLGDYNVSQYPLFLPLQQAVVDSMWANEYFGSTGGTSGFVANFISTNKEYKPAPGAITRYQLGAQEGEAVPGWHEAIVSDESSRFPINMLLNIIYSSHNIDYDDPEEPWVRRDQFDEDLDDLNDFINGTNGSPSYGGYLMARDILISLLMTDADMARLADSWDGNLYNSYKDKATWILRQMLTRRRQMDVSSDFNRNGDYEDDESSGEIFQFPEMLQNNDSQSIPDPYGIDVLDGSGRMGDAQDLWDGTWRVYTDPKEILTDFIGENPPAFGRRINQNDFSVLNERITVYSMDTEHTADPEHQQVLLWQPQDVRFNIQRMASEDNINTSNVNESALYNHLRLLIGTARLESIINWRDGLVDLNGDGDLLDEYIEQPVSRQVFDPDNNTYDDADDNPVSTLTYRERNHPNFQDPSLEQQYIDPDYLNLNSIGDLLTVPMSASEGLVAYSEADSTNQDPELVIKTENGGDPDGIPRDLNDRGLYPDFSNGGSDIAYDDGTDVIRNNLLLDDDNTIENNRLHPSWGPGDGTMAFYNGDDIRLYNFGTGNDASVLNNAGMPPDIDDTSILNFWDNFGPQNLIGNAIFEMGSPDINPEGSFNEIAFSQVATTDTEFLDPDAAYNIALLNMNNDLITLLTDNSEGTYDYAPDFSSNGQEIVFTRTSYDPWGVGFLYDIIPFTYLMTASRTGGMPTPLIAFWDVSDPDDPSDTGHYIDWDLTNINYLEITMHQPMFPSWSPDGQKIVFMDIPVTFRLSTSTFQLQAPFIAQRPNICVISADTPFQNWSEVSYVLADTDTYQIFPDWGLGSVRLTRQGDTQNGTVAGTAIDMSHARLATTDVTPEDAWFTEDDRQNIAWDIGEASLAFRETRWDPVDQNWLLKDLPLVPEHVVDAMRQVADVVCFRDPYVSYDPRYQAGPPTIPPTPSPTPPLQAYQGRVNINTASRPVLRSLFLLMFQGPENDPDNDGDPNVPQPRFDNGPPDHYFNIMDPAFENDDINHFRAIMVAEKYAHQVCEYRRWIYNNLGQAGVTDETVPSNLPLYEMAYDSVDPPVSHYGNYRGNPFYPLIDAAQDGGGNPELQRMSPDPPFRSIADLFSVMLYDDQEYSEDWTYDGIGGSGGPDENDLPRPLDSAGNTTGFVNALDIWGPIYNASDERTVSHPSGVLGAGGRMYGFEATVDNDIGDPNYNEFYQHQMFRLFSADDFRRIAPYITTRTYNYRIESRGVVRISSGVQRTDITRDKVWIITTNSEASFGARLDPTWDVTVPFDWSFIAQNRGTNDYYVLFFEESPQSGLAVARDSFVPE